MTLTIDSNELRCKGVFNMRNTENGGDLMNEYGVRYSVSVGREMRAATKERFFATEAARTQFIEKLERHDNFIEVLAYSNPRE